jgi:hypothetical protein
MMLYDKRWDKSVDLGNPFSLESLIAWLEKQPAAAVYDWSQPRSCLLGQWCQFNGLIDAAVGDKSLEIGTYDRGRNIFFKIAMSEPYTFGAALERAREFSRQQ